MKEQEFKDFLKGNNSKRINDNVMLVHESTNIFEENVDDLTVEVRFMYHSFWDNQDYTDYWRGFVIKSRDFEAATLEIRECIIEAFKEYGAQVAESFNPKVQYEVF